jgi:FkbM family methyltransferase
LNGHASTIKQRIARRLIRNLARPAAALVGRLSSPRGLTPYPGWRFDVDFDNPGVSFRRRRALWQMLQTLDAPVHVTARWHHGTRLCLNMHNDIARQVFIGAAIDPNEFSFLDRVLKPGMVVADVGANEGLYTVFFASIVKPGGRVLAFEPSSRERTRLAKNVELNSFRNVEIFPLALTDRCGEVRLEVAGDPHSGHNTLGKLICDVPLAGVEQVPAATLDSLFESRKWDRLDIVKADVEGAELLFLKGAEQTLRRHYPLLVMEAFAKSLEAQGCTLDSLFGFLGGLGYEIHDFSLETGLPAPAAGPASNESHNFVAIPGRETRRGRTLHYNLDWA